MLVNLKSDASKQEIINAINVLSAAEPGINNAISGIFNIIHGKINSLNEEKDELINDINKISKYLDNKIDNNIKNLLVENKRSYGMIFGKYIFIFSIRKLINNIK